MRFSFDKAACQNTRRAMHREWLLANRRGDCSSSSILCCNTRKYHGLLAVTTPQGRHVLLSTLEESVWGGGRGFFCRRRGTCFLPGKHRAQRVVADGKAGLLGQLLGHSVQVVALGQ